jgi:hypothetical protein
MPGKAAKITISESQQEILGTFSRSTTAPSRLRQRASIIVLAFDGLLNEDIAERVGLTHRQVGRWRRRWADAWNRLIDIECCESRAALLSRDPNRYEVSEPELLRGLRLS